MTTTKTLAARKREATGKGAARTLRRAGRVPAVLYGKDMEPTPLSVDAREADHLFQAISVENTIVELKVEGERRAHQTLVREVQTHAFRSDLVHIDFLRVRKGVRVDVEIPVHLDGVPAGVRLHGGVLEQLIHELPVRCVPSAIPPEVRVDVTGLEVGEAVHVSDLDLGEGVEVTIPVERTVCAVAVPRTPTLDEEEAAAAEAAEVEPELVGEAAGEEPGSGSADTDEG